MIISIHRIPFLRAKRDGRLACVPVNRWNDPDWNELECKRHLPAIVLVIDEDGSGPTGFGWRLRAIHPWEPKEIVVVVGPGDREVSETIVKASLSLRRLVVIECAQRSAREWVRWGQGRAPRGVRTFETARPRSMGSLTDTPSVQHAGAH